MARITSKGYMKPAILLGLFIIELSVTCFSYYDKWGDEIKSPLVFAGIMMLYIGLKSIVDEFDPRYKEMREASKKEHDEIKGILSLYKDLQLEDTVINFEGEYAKEHDSKNVEIWIISNSVAENEKIIQEIFNNLTLGVKYYYIIPNNSISRSEEDLKNTFERIKELNKNSTKCLSIKYIKDDLFDLMPTEIVDILFYCNPYSTDYYGDGCSDNMKVYYSLQCAQEDIYYKPVNLNEKQKEQFFIRMKKWKKERKWLELKG